MFTCCSRHNISHSPSEHIYELPQYDNVGRDSIPPPIPPPRRTRLLLDDYGYLHPPNQTNKLLLNLLKFNTKSSLFNSSPTCQNSFGDSTLLKNSIRSLPTSFTDVRTEIEPLFTVELKIKNERSGMTINRKIFM
jgi:hypothetical protein